MDPYAPKFRQGKEAEYIPVIRGYYGPDGFFGRRAENGYHRIIGALKYRSKTNAPPVDQ
jgi:hypothetical protein